MVAPSDSQWAFLSTMFPNLVRAHVDITGPPSFAYNCIGYTLGILVDGCIQPPDPLSLFQALYNGAPYNHPTLPANDAAAMIDGWALPALGPDISEMTHGSKVYPTTPPLWESKLGFSYRITHGRDELTGANYGRIVTSFA